MKFYDSKGKEVEILETDGGLEEGYVYAAQYINEDTEVPESELDYLTETYAEYVYESELNRQIGAAEAAFEGDR